MIIEPAAVESGTFQDSVLGIHFPYNSLFVPLKDTLGRNPAEKNLSKWKLFTAKEFGISLRYPPEMEARIVLPQYYRAEDCDSGKYIELKFRGATVPPAEDKLTKPAVQIQLVRGTFENIALISGFEHPPLDKELTDSQAKGDQPDVGRWMILGGQLSEDATEIDGDKWHGLRGENTTQVLSRSDSSFHKLSPFSKSLLVRSGSGDCSVVCSYFQGPAYYIEDAGGPQLDEVTFYKIIGTITLEK